MNNAIVITGVNGGIGQALVSQCLLEGYSVIAIDCHNEFDDSVISNLESIYYLSVDLNAFANDEAVMECFKKELANVIQKNNLQLVGLVNNAAVQLLADVASIELKDAQKTFSVNVIAPLLLSQLCLPFLQESNGAIVNIGSIHAQQTKPGFVCYASSKAAVRGLTQSMAVDLSGAVRVNAIEPAAIATPMLKAGFIGESDKLNELAACHPTGRIGEPKEVAELCLFLLSAKASFINGSCIGLDGGIAAKLVDPT